MQHDALTFVWFGQLCCVLTISIAAQEYCSTPCTPLHHACHSAWLCSMQVVECVLAMIILQKYILCSTLMAILLAAMIHKALQRYKQARRLAKYVRWPYLVPYVAQGGVVRGMGARQLVPGDVIVVQTGIAVCDAVLLRGGCLCEQSTLTGEVRIAKTCCAGLWKDGVHGISMMDART